MLTKFWEGLGGKLAEQWAGRVLTPAFIFWAGGLAAWVWGNLGGDIRRKGWKAALDQHDSVLRGLPAVVQVSLLIAVLIGLVASALIAERITLPLVRLLEGYWPGGQPRWFRNKLIKHNLTKRASVYERMADLVEKRDRKCLSSREYSEFLALKQRVMTAVMPDRTPSGWLRATWNNSQHKADRQRLEVLTAKREGQGLPPERLAEHGLAGAEETNLSQLEQRLRRLPVTSALMMPTRLGNVLRAAEERPRMKYGLDAVVCWPHLWMVLDKDAKDELTQSRAALDGAARVWLWGVLFAVWTVWTWWALPLALLVACSAYYVSMLSAAETYSDLIDAAFDLHRPALYRALRWPLPKNPAEESEHGENITEYLWRGSDRPTPIFEP